MKPCSNCTTPIPGRSCPHCGEKASSPRIPTAIAVLGLSMAALSPGCATAMYGIVSEEVVRPEDGDLDGYGEDDCDDANPDIYPGAQETAGDGVDSNCDGEDDPQA